MLIGYLYIILAYYYNKREREGVEGNGDLRENRGVYIVSLF